MSDNHNWTDDDNVIGYYLYRFGNERLTISRQALVEKLGMSLGSMGRKVGNFRYLDSDGETGLHGCSAQAKNIYKKFKDMPNNEFAFLVEDSILSKIETELLSVTPEGNLEKQVQAMQAKLEILQAQLENIRR